MMARGSSRNDVQVLAMALDVSRTGPERGKLNLVRSASIAN